MKPRFQFSIGTLLAFSFGILLVLFSLFYLWLKVDYDRYLWMINGPGIFAYLGGLQYSLFSGFIAPIIGSGLVIISLVIAYHENKKK